MIALNYPLLALFSDASTLFGVPVLYLYLFFLWAIFILLVALTLTRKGKKESAIDTQGDKPRG